MTINEITQDLKQLLTGIQMSILILVNFDNNCKTVFK